MKNNIFLAGISLFATTFAMPAFAVLSNTPSPKQPPTPCELASSGMGSVSATVQQQRDMACLSYRLSQVEAENALLKKQMADLQPNAQFLSNLAQVVSIQPESPSYAPQGGKKVTFTGANIYIQSGSGSTSDSNGGLRGLGNLTIGYNEPSGVPNGRVGSHNLILGQNNDYTSFGGFVAGYLNTISGTYASISGGNGSIASGNASSVSGGSSNIASGNTASVSGGNQNTASGSSASISGGIFNMSTSSMSSVSGGYRNTATDWYASVSGGILNNATAKWSSISGGRQINLTIQEGWAAGGTTGTPTFHSP